jgi:uncharacterized iron-regulated membrane protein
VGFFRQLLQHPRQRWVRRLNFQIHLWLGVILALYVVLICVTGSILVFGSELSKLLDPNPWPPLDAKQPTADLRTVVLNLQARYPYAQFVSVMAPTPNEPVFTATLITPRRIIVACDPVTGQILGPAHKLDARLNWIYELHENLLARRTGRVVNGIAAASLMLLVLTGLVNWWPGIKNWRRGLTVDVRRRWKRINFDLHSAVGFWSFSLLLIWASTGVYFAWPAKITALIDRVSPLVTSQPPSVHVELGDVMRVDLHAVLAKAYSVDPGTRWKGIVFPGTRRSPVELLMSRSTAMWRDYEDTLYFNPYTGDYICKWQYGVNKSLGDWIIWLLVPLHFGTHWGLAVKCLWALLGLALPALSVTGLLMYWNRAAWLKKFR